MTLIKAIQQMIAVSAAGASALRNLGSTEAPRTAADFLSRTDLGQFALPAEY